MELPLQNRVIVKATMTSDMKEHQLNDSIVKQQLAVKLALEFIEKKVGMDKIGTVGDSDIIEYTMEAWLFTKDQLAELINNAYGEGYNEGVDDGMNK
jgi:hypothetical protein